MTEMTVVKSHISDVKFRIGQLCTDPVLVLSDTKVRPVSRSLENELSETSLTFEQN